MSSAASHKQIRRIQLKASVWGYDYEIDDHFVIPIVNSKKDEMSKTNVFQRLL